MNLTTFLLFYFHVLCWGWNAEPAFVRAVWAIESPQQTWGRIGRSPYYAPGGVKGCFLKDFTTEEVMGLSIKALRDTGTDAKKIARLKRYNPNWRENRYLGDLMAAYRQNRRQR